MRQTCLKLLVLGAMLAFALGTGALAQPGGRGPGGRSMDPAERFKMLSGGKDAFDIATVEIPQELTGRESAEKQKEAMKEFLTKKGVKDTKMTLDLYKDYMADRMAGFSWQFVAQGNDYIDLNTYKPQKWGREGKEPEETLAQMKSILEKKGVKDGKMTRELYVEFVKIQMDERAAAAAKDGEKKDEKKEERKEEKSDRDRDRKSDRDSERSRRSEEPEKPKVIVEEKRVIYRANNLPKELPAWFAELDKDKDAQVGFYEWKSGGKEVPEFVAIDANGDGLITVEEALRYVKAVAASKDNGKSLVTAAGPMFGAGSGTTSLSASKDNGSTSSGKSDKWGGKWGDKGGEKADAKDAGGKGGPRMNMFGGGTGGGFESMAKNRIAEYDTDKDGKLNASEIEAWGKKDSRSSFPQDWKKYDKNSNSYIEAEEYTEYLQQRFGGGKGGKNGGKGGPKGGG